MRLSALSVCVIALISGAIAYAALRPAMREASPHSAPAADRVDSGLKVTGHVDGLYPGAVTRLRVRIRNPFGFDVVVRSVRARVKAAAGCGPENLSVTRFRGHRLVPAGRARRVRLPIAMSAAEADPCQGAKFPLRFAVRAQR
jgi:hypothetical protein